MPGVCAGPIPKSSEIPWESKTGYIPGYSSRAYISEANIKVLSIIE